MSRTDTAQILWADPLVRLARAMRHEAETIRAAKQGDDPHAASLDRAAERLEAAIEEAATVEYVDSEAAARFLEIGAEAVRARCRRKLRKEGLARKRGGKWEIHASVLAA